MAYGKSITLDTPFAETMDRVREALSAQGFGVLTEIDVTATMRAKLGEEMENYVILGACNPPLAHRALVADRGVGLLLPCNVVVRSVGERTVVEMLNPNIISALANSPQIDEIAGEAGRRLDAALAAVAAPPPGPAC